MEALAKNLPQPEGRYVAKKGLLAHSLPTLWPYMLVPKASRTAVPFPFDEPSATYFYFARNGIFALARLWGLAGKEVLFPSYFHGVELETLIEAGVRPAFYPVRERMRVNAEEVIERIGPRTGAVYLTHYVGFPGPVEALAEACKERGVKLIEDCALSLLSSVNGRPLGSFGDAAVFCLYKTLPTPDGGVLVVRGQPVQLPDGEAPTTASTLAHSASSLLLNLEIRGGAAGQTLRRLVRTVGNAASRASGATRVPVGSDHFDRTHAGLSMSRLSRQVISAQDFPTVVERRRRNFFHLLGQLRGVAQPVFAELPAGTCPLFYPMLVKRKQVALARLQAQGVNAIDFWGIGHPSVPDGAFPETDELRKNVLEIPCHQDLSPEVVDRLAQVVREVLEEVS